MVADLTAQGGWTPSRLGAPTGSRAGWWGLSAPVEALLDELVTWRELAQHSAARQPDWDRYETLPDWARLTLAEHAEDPRPTRYSPAQLEAAATHDPLWNAAQRELVREGRMHNYMRMLWGKKVLEWCASPEEAFALLLHLNDKYALDGRDPSSVAGVSWIFGRFDRAWGPERPIFGKIRYMSSDNTARKLEVKAYLRRYGQQAPLLG
jgi:deoxyribodipyrimidine photo-lyase